MDKHADSQSFCQEAMHVTAALFSLAKTSQITAQAQQNGDVLGQPKSSPEFFHNILQKNPNEFLGQPSIILLPGVGGTKYLHSLSQ